jgi:hypothetical protein
MSELKKNHRSIISLPTIFAPCQSTQECNEQGPIEEKKH